MSFDPEKFDFDRCDEEPIHRPGSIQNFGFLIAVDPDTLRIALHSDNLDGLVRMDGRSSLVGTRLLDLLDDTPRTARFLRESFARATGANVRLPLTVHLAPAVTAEPGRTRFSAVVYASGGLMVLELEPASAYEPFNAARQQYRIYAKNVAPAFAEMRSVEQVADAVAGMMRELTGFERVIVYRFNPDSTGTVISESKLDALPAYLGLTYPASDIPSQARALYLKNWIRLNPDVAEPTVGLVPALDEGGRAPLDLTLSMMRAMSPIHAQYVLNQGLRATMSISLIIHGRLWGLISCHHRSPHYLPMDVRLECENLGHLFAWQFHAKEQELRAGREARVHEIIERLIERLAGGENILSIFRGEEDDVLGLMNACGFAFLARRRMVRIGRTPDRELVRRMAGALAGQGHTPGHTEQLAALDGFEGAELDGICGALVVPMLPNHGYFTVWFRDETRRTIRWAGNPDEHSPDAPKEARLTPRTSFQLHEREVTDHSVPWTSADIEAAQRLNKFFVRYAFEQTESLHADIDELEIQERTKDEFLATLAHELRNPLAPISHAVQALRLADPDDERRRVFDLIDRQLRHLVTLIDDLLDVSRISRGKVRLQMRRLTVQSIVERAVEMYRAQIDARDHHLEVRLPEQSLWVRGDLTRLTQVVGNVLHNAVKYTEPGGRISVRLERSGERARLEVEDNGFGISPEDQAHIFDMFSQVDASRSTPTQGGLGIGLTLVRKLVEYHHGDIRVSSPGVGGGSRFTIELPLSASPEGARDVEAAAEAPPEPADPLRILVVDDHEDIAATLEMLLELKGHRPVTCGRAEDAIESFRARRFDVALLDLGLPDMDGLSLCRALRGMPGGDRTFFVAQTGWGQEADRARTQAAGFHRHLVKPISGETLDAVLAEVSSRTDD